MSCVRLHLCNCVWDIIRIVSPDWQVLRQPAATPLWCMLSACISSSLSPRKWQVDFIVEESKDSWRDGRTDTSRNARLKKESVTVFPVYPFRATPACLTFPPAMSNVPYTTLRPGCTALIQWTMRWQRFVCVPTARHWKHAVTHNIPCQHYTHILSVIHIQTHIQKLTHSSYPQSN